MQTHFDAPIRRATERLDTPGSGRQKAPAPRLEIRVLGEFTVLRDGVPLGLPPSRKTRALLAYLAIDGRRHQRERLCELFWELPDDPRAALRWSLSRIRHALGGEAENLLQADRSTVKLCLADVSFDYATMRRLTQVDLNACARTLLEGHAAQFSGPFLADLSLPRCPEFEAWRAAISGELDVLHIRLLRALIDRAAAEPERALAYAHQLRRLSPDDRNLARKIGALAHAARESAMTRPLACELMRDRVVRDLVSD
jgi:DNA-binding SARP family transcriptional activator